MTIDIMAERRTGPQHADPVGQIRALLLLLDELGLPGELRRSQELLARSEELGQAARTAKAAAEQRYRQAYERLLTGQLDATVFGHELVTLMPWMDNPPDLANMQPRPAPAMAAMMNAARESRSRAGQLLAAEASGIHGRLQGVARQVVAATAALPTLPRAVWSAPEPHAVAVREGYGDTMRDLWQHSDRFDTVHKAARICRDSGGLGAQAMLNGPPEPLAFTARNWRKAVEEMAQLKLVKPPLKLRWMVDHDWQPGLWLADDLRDVEPERPRRGPLGFLVPSPLRPAG